MSEKPSFFAELKRRNVCDVQFEYAGETREQSYERALQVMN